MTQQGEPLAEGSVGGGPSELTVSRRASLRRRTRPIRHAAAFLFLRAAVAVVRVLPLRVALTLGAGFARCAGPLFRRDSRTMHRQLAVLADPPTVGDCWADLGRRLVELACARRLVPDVCVHGEALGQQAHPNGVLVATAHLGNWELMAAALAARGHAVHAIAATPQGGPLFRWLAEERAALGVHTHPPGRGARDAARILREGGSVALFVDLATRERGREVTLFGRRARMPCTIERLRALTGADVVFAWTHRDADGRHHVHLEAVDDPSLEGLAARVESAVRAHPLQWVWLHHRWPA